MPVGVGICLATRITSGGVDLVQGGGVHVVPDVDQPVREGSVRAARRCPGPAERRSRAGPAASRREADGQQHRGNACPGRQAHRDLPGTPAHASVPGGRGRGRADQDSPCHRQREGHRHPCPEAFVTKRPGRPVRVPSSEEGGAPCAEPGAVRQTAGLRSGLLVLAGLVAQGRVDQEAVAAGQCHRTRRTSPGQATPADIAYTIEPSRTTLVATVTSQRRRSSRYIGRPMRTMPPKNRRRYGTSITGTAGSRHSTRAR